MPVGQDFYNPYRLVQQPGDRPERKYEPDLRTLNGYLGKLICRLDVYTPLEVNYAANERFNKNPKIPGSSLKGMLRSIAEFVGGGCMSIRGQGDEGLWRLCDSAVCCPTCDMFGRMMKGKNGQKNRGKIRIDDALPIQFGRHEEIRIIQGSPKEKHDAFYPKSGQKKCYRKLYHHHTQYLTGMRIKERANGKMQPASLFPVSSGSTFRFEIAFDTLSSEEVGLLAYALELEPGLLHKMGRGKGRGLGSVKIRIETIEIQEPADHFRGQKPDSIWPEDVRKAIDYYHKAPQLNEFRKIVSWDMAKQIEPLRYPSYQWFKDNSQVELRKVDEIIPTLPPFMTDPELPRLATPVKATPGGTADISEITIQSTIEEWHNVNVTFKPGSGEIEVIRAVGNPKKALCKLSDIRNQLGDDLLKKLKKKKSLQNVVAIVDVCGNRGTVTRIART